MRKNAVKNIAERLSLPEDALMGGIRVTLSGEGFLIAENHGGILEYTDSRVVLAAGKRRLSVTGTELVISAMNRSELALRGKISSVEIL